MGGLQGRLKLRTLVQEPPSQKAVVQGATSRSSRPLPRSVVTAVDPLVLDLHGGGAAWCEEKGQTLETVRLSAAGSQLFGLRQVTGT